MRHNRLLAAALGLSIVVLAATAHAQRLGDRYSMLGAPLRSGQNVVGGGLGWPGLWGQYDMGLSDGFSLGLRAGLGYGSPIAFQGGYGLSVAVPMRIGLSSGDKVSIALTLTPTGDLLFGGYSTWGPYCTGPFGTYNCWVTATYAIFSFGFEPGVMVGINLGRNKPITVLVGGAVPLAWYLPTGGNAGGWFAGAVVAQGGVEIQVIPKLNVGGLLRVGPAFTPFGPTYYVSLTALVEYLL